MLINTVLVPVAAFFAGSACCGLPMQWRIRRYKKRLANMVQPETVQTLEKNTQKLIEELQQSIAQHQQSFEQEQEASHARLSRMQQDHEKLVQRLTESNADSIGRALASCEGSAETIGMLLGLVKTFERWH